MIDTVAALAAFIVHVNTAMMNPDYAWPSGRSWALSVKSILTSAQILANTPSCCNYLMVDGVVYRSDTTVFLLKK